MEFYPKDDLDTCVETVEGESEIQKIYSGSQIFITGVTGFMGKILLEKILRSCNVAKVYILVREKRGKLQEERLLDLLNDPVFERMLLENRTARQSIFLMNGDCSLPNLGLSEDNLRILHEEINFVFHTAATVNMGEHLRTAFKINVNGTRCLLEHAKSMKKLKAFVYVSTAYSQMITEIEEKFYPTQFTPDDLQQIVQDLDDSQLSAITPLLIGDTPNTYSFTKAVTEYMVSTYHPEIPVAVARPSIITSSVSEPIVGWIDNIYGATGVSAGAMVGLLRLWRADPHALADLIPIDIVVNSILAVAAHVTVHRPKSENKIVFNMVSSRQKPITWERYMSIIEKTGYDERLVSMVQVGSYRFRLVKNATLFWIYTILYHFIPGLLSDIVMRLVKMDPKFLYAYRKVYRTNIMFAAYCVKEFKYIDDNVDEVWSLMNAKDKQIFNFDMSLFQYEAYFRDKMRGIRVYLFKDPMHTLEDSRKLYYMWHYFSMATRCIMYLIGGVILIASLMYIFKSSEFI